MTCLEGVMPFARLAIHLRIMYISYHWSRVHVSGYTRLECRLTIYVLCILHILPVVDGAIHRGAGPQLLRENITIHQRCDVGDVKVAAGYLLPADCEYMTPCYLTSVF